MYEIPGYSKLPQRTLSALKEGILVMKNKKSKLRSNPIMRGRQGNWHMYMITILLFLILLSLPAVNAQLSDSGTNWDKPFDKPMWLLHTNGGKYYDSNGKEYGTVIEEMWILDPNNNGFINKPNPKDEGSITRYSIDQTLGPYQTPREVCGVTEAATSSSALKYPRIVQGSDFVRFNCNDIPAQPEKPNKPEEGPCANACDRSKHLVWDGYEGCNCICEKGWKFDEHGDCELDTSEADELLEGGIKELEGEILVVTPQGTTAVKPSEEGQIILSPGEIARIDAKCENLMMMVTVSYLVATASAMGDYVDVGRINDILPTLKIINIACESLKSGKPIKLHKTAEFSDTSSSSDYPVKLEFSLQSGSLRIETVHDQVALDVKTPTMTVSSEGKNTFGVAFDPNSGRSLLSAYQNPIHIQPSNSNLGPFTLGAGQQVEVSSEEIGPVTPLSQTPGGTEGSTHVSPDGRDIYGPAGGAGNAAGQTGATSEVPQGGCYTDPSTGQMICVDRISDFVNPEGGNQEPGGCYADPMTGDLVCVDAFGEVINPSSSTGTAYTTQPDAGSSVPQSLQECETYTSEICGTWTRMGDQFNAQWDNGASATLNVERWDNGAVVLTRQDTVGSSAGLTARYEGRCTENHVEGMVTWTWNGSTWSGTWSANW